MIEHINSLNRSKHAAAMDGMFRDRKKIFVDVLKWDVPVLGYYEIDQFDNDDAEYVIVCDPDTGEHYGSMRILRTDRPHILGDIFSTLCEVEVPRGPEYRELTRLCLSPRLRARDRLLVRNRLFTNLVEYALLTGIRGFSGVAEIGWYSQLLSLGWRCTPLGLPKLIDGETLAAVLAHVDGDTLHRFREAGTYYIGELTLSPITRSAA